MITKRIVRAFMITAMMIISTNIVEAQRINREALQKLSQASEASPAVTVQATAPESNVALEPAGPVQEEHQGGLLETKAAQKKKAIVGSWLYTMSVTNGPTFKVLSTYTEDGSVMFSDQMVAITDPSFPHCFSAGHGVWGYLGGGTFSQTSLQLISDLTGDLIAVFKLRETITLIGSGDAYTSVFKATFTDPAGNLTAAFEGTTEGQRIKAEPLP